MPQFRGRHNSGVLIACCKSSLNYTAEVTVQYSANLQEVLDQDLAGCSDPLTFALQLQVHDLSEEGEEGEEGIVVELLRGGAVSHVQPHTFGGGGGGGGVDRYTEKLVRITRMPKMDPT